MADSLASGLPGAAPNPAGLVEVLLNVSLTGTMLLRPLYAAGSEELIDFDWVRLNNSAQRMLRLPEHPAQSFLTLFPSARQVGVFSFYQAAFLSGQLAHRQNLYQHDGLDGYYVLAAQRHEDLLVVNFSDANEQSRTTIEKELRASQARETAARAAAERQRGELERVFEQAPVAIAVYRGPQYIIELANPTVCRLWGRTAEQIVGKGLFEALPEVAGMGYEELLDGVMATGVPYVAHAMEAVHEREGRRDTVYWDFVYVPMYEADGSIYGAMVVATEVTEQVLGRRQLEEKERQTNFLNEELQAANEEILANNAELGSAQQQLRQLNQQLEARVQERTYQLEEQQSLLRQILGQLPAAVATLSGPEHRFAFANAGYQQLVAGRATLGQTVAEALPEVVEQGIINLLDHVYASREPFIGREIALILVTEEGVPTQHYFDFTYQPLVDGQNQVQGILVFAIDVTEQVRTRRQTETLQAAMLAVAQRQQAERENVYQLFEQAPAAICLMRERGHRIDYLNPAYQALFPGQLLQGKTLAQVQPDARELLTLFDGVYATGTTQTQREVPLTVAPSDQPAEARYFDFTYQAYREQGRIVGVSLFGTDVTDRVLARQAREAQQAELQRIFEQAPVAIAIMRGPQLIIELANAAVGAIWGRPPAQTLGRPYFEALPDTAGQGFEEILHGVLQTGEAFSIVEAPVQLARAHTGLPTQGYVNFIFQPLYGEDRQITGLIAMGTEVTDQVLARQQVHTLNQELRTANEELNDANKRLTRTNTDLDTFVYSASHDLKSPITNIEGLLLALRQQLPPAAMQAELVARLLSMMDGAVSRFQETLGHLTDVSRLQQVLLGQPAEAVELPALVEAVRLDMLPEFTAAGATLTVDVAGCPTLYFSAKNLRSMLYNLLSNAVKYRDPARPAHVELRCHPSPGQVVLEVQDNGMGLSELQQSELFRLFRRLHTHVPGSGVGLYMVKKMVDNADGTLAVQSQPGAGSTFTITLPLPTPPQA
ncbi:PAS domain-containing protein [Hymenobacter sp. RP-2-7]|uniref:histidine kinase n=1 Tax=Hymenobacter polaris TaxID=2682546 RepID=A0A7Y0AGM7_9BACT|nr:PAS domain-containing protein [Hymenobacter polaris]NML67009.1 PAS domain-containing protein [Hymenobacter polaris]